MSWLGKIGAMIVLFFNSIGGFFGFHNNPAIPVPMSVQQTAITTADISTSTSLLNANHPASSSTSDRLAGEAVINAKFTFNNCPKPIKSGPVILGNDLVTDTSLDRSCATTASSVLIYNGLVYLVPEPNNPTWGGRAALVPSADPKTFTPLGNEYWKDESHIYYQQFPLPDADPTSWLKMTDVSLMGHHFSKDKNHVYFYNQIVPSVDASSFELVSDTTAKDSQAVYLYRTGDGVILTWSSQTVFPTAPLAIATGYAKFSTVKGSSPTSVITLKNGFSKDSKNVYYQLQWIKGADPASFIVLTNNYAKDVNAVWYYSSYDSLTQLQGVDAVTFTAVNPEALDNLYNVAWGKDKNSVFRENTKLEGADPASFQANLMNGQFYNYYAKDKNYVYYSGKILAGIDPATFKVIDDGSQKDCGYDAVIADKNGYYSQSGQKFEGSVDAATFKVLGMGYYSDKNNVWRGTTLVPGANPTTFKIPECSIG